VVERAAIVAANKANLTIVINNLIERNNTKKN
jgi:hypothetical protein